MVTIETKQNNPIDKLAIVATAKGKEDIKKEDSTSFSTLLQLLGNEIKEEKNQEKDSFELNPEISKNLSPADLKILIKEAKEILKNKIIATDGFKRAEIAKLPKTLKGVLKVAKKIGLDVSKIKFEVVKGGKEKELKPLFKLKTSQKSLPRKQSVHIKTLHVKPWEKEKTRPIKTTHDNLRELLQGKNEIRKNPKLSVEHKSKTTEVKVVHETPKSVEQKIAKPQKEPQKDLQTEVKVVYESLKTVAPKMVNEKHKVEKKEVTLRDLLGTKKGVQQQEGSKMTADFVVATAKVIAPQDKTQSVKSLESLLSKGEHDEEKSTPKHEAVHIAKADSFEVKINEAKQLTKYLSGDVKHAIENYKAPFTRVKVQLNPQKLGEVDLTIVQRGKNLHVNLSSNNAAINALAMNVNDLKVQLQNNGIQNASLNFSNNTQGDQNAAGGQPQQQQQNRQNAHEEYNFFENEEKNEEVVSSLEIVVPHYA